MNIQFNEILNKVFLIRVNGGQGSCFLLSNNNRRFIITARHLFAQPGNYRVEVCSTIDGKVLFQPLPGNGVISYPKNNADIAVLEITKTDFLNYEGFKILENYNPTGYDDLYILGFPNLAHYFPLSDPRSDYPLPICKKTSLAGFGIEADTKVIYTPTITPIGFSGSPLLIYKDNELRVIGVQNANKFKIANTIDPLVRELQNGVFVREPEQISFACKIDYLTEIINS
jgi:hypothetical protein